MRGLNRLNKSLFNATPKNGRGCELRTKNKGGCEPVRTSLEETVK